MLCIRSLTLVFVVGVVLASPVVAQDWSTVDYIEHSQYQAVNEDGSPAWSGGFPIRFVGVVLNNTEDWLDPTADYDDGYTPWYMGGQAEIFVQAVNLDDTTWDPFPGQDFADFGGTACWMGQNYGNHMMNQDPLYSYTNDEWTAELARLNFQGGDAVTDPIRAGDLVEIRARGGLHYEGKMNVNEQHDNDYDRYDDWDGMGSDGDGENHDFEVVRLVSGFGLPEAAELTLDVLKDGSDAFYFDHTRQTGGERYQSTWVELKDVYLEQTDWTGEEDDGPMVVVNDGAGRSIEVQLGYANGYDWSQLGADWDSLFGDDPVSITGILNQSADDRTYSTDGYYLVALGPDYFVPEPMSLSLLAISGAALLCRRRSA
ncbi:MAG: PEP-CTERM sorting domain-containing protein [Planctomycetota bacterium]